MEKKTVVAFGNKIDAETLEQIQEATQELTNDFPMLKDQILFFGERTALDKVNAINDKISESKHYIAIEKKRLGQQVEIEDYEYAPYLDQNGDDTLAYYDKRNGALIVNPNWVSESKYDAELRFESNEHASDKKIGTIYHEYGHAVDKSLENIYASLPTEKTNSIIETYREKMWQYYRENTKYDLNAKFKEKYGVDIITNDEFTNIKNEMLLADMVNNMAYAGDKPFRVSQYADASRAEFVAECFSAHYTGMNNELATKVVNLYKYTLKQLGEIK